MNEYIGHICQMCKHKDYCYLGQGEKIDACVLGDNKRKEQDDLLDIIDTIEANRKT